MHQDPIAVCVALTRREAVTAHAVAGAQEGEAYAVRVHGLAVMAWSPAYGWRYTAAVEHAGVTVMAVGLLQVRGAYPRLTLALTEVAETVGAEY